MTRTIEQLEQAAADAEAKATRARDQAVAEQQRREDARQARLDAYDQARLNNYDDIPLEADVMAAQQALTEAVATDPVVQAAAAVIAAQVRRSEEAAWASNTANRFGVPSPVVSSPPASFVNVPELEGRVISELASDLSHQAAESEQAEREQAGEAG